MTQKELAERYGSKKEKKVGLKDKKKAKKIFTEILECHKCKGTSIWIKDTNRCYCPKCTYPIGKKEDRRTMNVTKTISEKGRRFLERNFETYEEFLEENQGVENA